MTPTALGDTLAQVVRDVPGVAFLTPGIAGRLRSAFQDPRRAGLPGAGVRLNRTGETGSWEIEVRIVTLAGHRACDVTRATRSAILAHLQADGATAGHGAAVKVTITGIV
ncbi:Asp23/Gls24 family envelope stress response protein [Streptomyces sp. NPDC055808]|uniref:Asp23/Gls24 family envelope stress response protein n=1 Tax=Streptomyces sp. NPDC001828 TaxID=3364615 RepID=UPI0036BDACAB